MQAEFFSSFISPDEAVCFLRDLAGSGFAVLHPVPRGAAEERGHVPTSRLPQKDRLRQVSDLDQVSWGHLTGARARGRAGEQCFGVYLLRTDDASPGVGEGTERPSCS